MKTLWTSVGLCMVRHKLKILKEFFDSLGEPRGDPEPLNLAFDGLENSSPLVS